MKINFKNGISIHLNLPDEVDAEEFASKVAMVKGMINYGLNKFQAIEEFNEKEKSAKMKRDKLTIEDKKWYDKEIEKYRQMGLSDFQITKKLGKYPTFITRLAKLSDTKTVLRHEWKKLNDRGELNAANCNDTKEEEN